MCSTEITTSRHLHSLMTSIKTRGVIGGGLWVARSKKNWYYDSRLARPVPYRQGGPRYPLRLCNISRGWQPRDFQERPCAAVPNPADGHRFPATPSPAASSSCAASDYSARPIVSRNDSPKRDPAVGCCGRVLCCARRRRER